MFVLDFDETFLLLIEELVFVISNDGYYINRLFEISLKVKFDLGITVERGKPVGFINSGRMLVTLNFFKIFEKKNPATMYITPRIG